MATVKEKTARPSPLRSTKSFSRSADSETVTSSSPRSKRASTIQNGALARTHQPVTDSISEDVATEDAAAHQDAFDTRQAAGDEPSTEVPRGSVDFDELPIELISLTDSFIESLSVTSQPTPPNIDNISRLFQDFYAQAASHIDTHINTLLLRETRKGSPTPSTLSRTSTSSSLRTRVAANKGKGKPNLPSSGTSEQQMITSEELAERKKARRAIEQQRGTFEEGVERRLCEGIYSKIYRHRATQDEASDAKLRSKTAALAVVGIGLSDLGVELGNPSESPIDVSVKVEEVRKSLDGARTELAAMYDSRYPLGKLNHLRAAHQSIVDTLQKYHPSSSADEIMPMLIYTLVTMPPEQLHVISDLNFIERFRWEPKLTGEAAYCLTNLEACISFLDTVDLSTLRSNEARSGPVKDSSRPNTPRLETFPPAFDPLTTTAEGSDRNLKPPGSPFGPKGAYLGRNRRFSDLVSTPAQAIGAASDAVRNTADQGMKTISNSLEGSYRFFMGKLRETEEGASNKPRDVIIPKTLDDARRLISPTEPGDDAASFTSEGSSRPSRRDDKVLSLFGGRPAGVSRDHSADSSKSGGSLWRRPQDGTSVQEKQSTAATPATGNNLAVIDSVRNLGNTLNPMTRIAAGIGPFRGFGRTLSTPAAPQLKNLEGSAVVEGGDLSKALPDIAPTLPPKEMKKIAPPSKRFMEMQNPGDLRIGEVLELLRDYRRLAGALKELDAFK